MKKRLYKKTVFFVISFFLVILTATVSLTYIYIKNTENKIISETAGYLKNYLINLETADYSFSADILNKLNELHENSGLYSEEVSGILSSYHSDTGEGYAEWLYGKNLKTFFKTVESESTFLESADIYSVSGDRGISILFPEKSSSFLTGDYNSESGKLKYKEYSQFMCRYVEELKSFRFNSGRYIYSDNESDKDINTSGIKERPEKNIRFLELVFDFSALRSVILRNGVILLILSLAGLAVFYIFLLPEIRFYFEGRLENISNSLKEIIKGNREVRIYLPGDDNIAEIGNSLNSILDDSVQTDSELCREKEKFKILFENMPSGAVVLDSEGKLVYENNFVKSLFNGDYEPFPGIFYSVLNRGDSDVLFENLSYILSGEKQEYTHRCRLFRGASRHQFFEISIKSAFENESLKFVIITFIDLSSGGTRENLHLDYIKTGGMSRLAGTIANGLNNILQIINGYTEYLLLSGFDEEDFREVIENMIDASKRASVLTRHLKIFSRESSFSEPVFIDMNSLVGDLETILREIFHSGIIFSISGDGSEAVCLGDESQIEQVLINLCINAGEAIEGDGTVEIFTGTKEYSDDDVAGYPEAAPGKYVYVEVKDSGSGIPEEQIRKIFEPFYSTRKNGEAAGIGLSLSYSIVMNHKGFIHVVSHEGKGSVFTVNIPAAEKDAGKSGEGVSEVSEYRKNRDRSVLFVDDEELILSLGKIMLEKAGYNVITAAGGREAVDFMKNYEGVIDLMVFDLVMPEMSGKEAVEKINKIKKNIPVLFISGYAEKELNRAENYEILGKPFKSSDLISKISGILDKNN